ncbi:MAG TPA: sigma-70 family RNA polymerase sigma factor [Gaiellaceae bacterium]|jgi:RNA polymerase sigma-70 factor (ECF subfamily)|nr:sigma-70 family RNA polymerase sigma factor [Gaiellaceae bacterium]
MDDDFAHELEALYRSSYSRLCNVLMTVTGSREAAREAAQEAFAEALATRSRYRGEGPLEAWVWRIALRTAARLRPRAEASPLELDPAVHDPERDPELAAAVRALPPRRRLIVFLRYFGGLSYAEIALACGISEGTVGAALAQAHAALREELCAPTTTGAER